MKTLNSYNFKGKFVLVRADLNSTIVKGKVQLSERIKASVETLKELKKKKAKTVVIAHQGSKGKRDFTSLRQHAKLLNKFVKVKFVDDIIGRKAINTIRKLKDGEILLLENVKNLNEEINYKPNNKLMKLTTLFDYYVNDAFSVSHRKYTSIIGFPRVLKSCIGRVMEKELKALKRLNIKGALFILGGAKLEGNIKLLNNKVLAAGLFGQVCVIAKSKNLGAQNKFLKDKLNITGKLKRKLKNVKTPVDFAVNVNGKRKELKLNEFPYKYEIFDIGNETINLYKKEIKKAKKIFLKGTLGYCEDKKFCKGTKEILNTIAKSKAYSIIGGGDTLNAINKLKINKDKFNYISLSGGALISYVAGEKLPGLEALKK